MCKLLKALNLKLPEQEGQPPMQEKQDKPEPVNEKPSPNLVVGPLANFDYGSVPDIAKAIDTVVKRLGDGVVSYEPALSTVGMPKAYDIAVSIAAGSTHKAEGPKTLAFTIDGADPKLVVGEGFEAFAEDDIEARVRGAVSRLDDKATLTFDIPWAELKKEGTHRLNVGIEATATHRAAGPKTMEVVVKRRKPVLKVLGAFPDGPCEIDTKKHAAWIKKVQTELPKLIDVDGSTGKLSFKPPLDKLKHEAGDYNFTVSLAGTEFCLPADDVTTSFKVFMSNSEASQLFSKWLDANSKTLQPQQRSALKAAKASTAFDFRALPQASRCATPADVTKLVQQFSGEAKDGRDKIWALLGYPSVNSSAAYQMDDNITLEGHKFHITVSFNSTALPTAKLTGAADAIYTQLFMGPIAKMRVHGTMEFVSTTGGEKIHLFLGGVDGEDTPWATKIADLKKDGRRWKRDQGAERETQINAMQLRLDTWKTKMVTAITAKITELGALKF